MMNQLIGLDRTPAELTLANMVVRAVIVFLAGVLFLRLGARRSIARNANFDVLLSVVLGSVLSRAINGQAAFWPTLGVSAALVALHELLGFAASRVHFISELLKGRARLLVNEGEVDRAALQRSFTSYDDLEENLRINGNVSNPREVGEARLERSGQISVVKRNRSQR